MNRTTILVLSWVLVWLSIGQLATGVSADDFTETSFVPAFDTTDDSLTYYWGSVKTITLTRQVIGLTYQLCIGANQPTSEQQWINYTASQSNAEITFKQHTAAYTSDDEPLVYLLLTLYEEETAITNLTLTVIYPADQYNAQMVMQSVAIIGTVVFLGLMVILLLKRR